MTSRSFSTVAQRPESGRSRPERCGGDRHFPVAGIGEFHAGLIAVLCRANGWTGVHSKWECRRGRGRAGLFKVQLTRVPDWQLAIGSFRTPAPSLQLSAAMPSGRFLERKFLKIVSALDI